MGGVDVGDGGKGKRATNADVNMIPFIDLLMVTVAFLLITAVWVTNSRINANAQIPGPPDKEKEVTPQNPEKVLNVTIGESDFTLTWKVGSVVNQEIKVPKPSDAGDPPRYTELAKKFEDEWKANGQHKDPADQKVDQAVLHADNRLPFKEIVAVLDALYAPKREMKIGSNTQMVPVFNMTFSIR
ncbi:MAG: biopolymer transporter ExbD [Polyangiaceae bacterium]